MAAVAVRNNRKKNQKQQQQQQQQHIGVKYFMKTNSYFQNFHTILRIRARPDWANEFPDRTGLDTQIC